MTGDNHEIIKHAQSIANALRLAKHIEMSDDIIELINQLSTLSTNITQRKFTELQPILSDILKTQERQDWLSMADYLDVELTEFIQQIS